MKTKPILAYDTACAGASVALMVDGQVHTRAIDQTRQAADLVSTIDQLLREHGVTYTDLGCIVTTIGPGSFTGVRIGLAALHGFALVAHVPIKLISTLEAVAWQAIAEAPSEFYVTLRAGKGEVYAQRFAQADGRPCAIGDIFLAPESKTDWDATVIAHFPAPDAAVLCAIAHHLPAATLADAVPLYIRLPDAVVGAPHPWLRTN